MFRFVVCDSNGVRPVLFVASKSFTHPCFSIVLFLSFTVDGLASGPVYSKDSAIASREYPRCGLLTGDGFAVWEGDGEFLVKC